MPFGGRRSAHRTFRERGAASLPDHAAGDARGATPGGRWPDPPGMHGLAAARRTWTLDWIAGVFGDETSGPGRRNGPREVSVPSPPHRATRPALVAAEADTGGHDPAPVAVGGQGEDVPRRVQPRD